MPLFHTKRTKQINAKKTESAGVSNDNGPCLIEELLPPELQIRILSCLDDIADLSQVAAVSKTWKGISETSLLWKQFGQNSRNDFILKINAYKPRQAKSLERIISSMERQQPIKVSLFGEKELLDNMFQTIFEQNRSLLFIANQISLTITKYQDNNLKAVRDLNALALMDIALVFVRNEKDIKEHILKFGIERSTVLSLFVVMPEYKHEFKKQSSNLLVLQKDINLNQLFTQVINKVKQLHKQQQSPTCRLI